MKLISKVSVLQVKRAFVASDLAKPRKGKQNLFETVKQRVGKMNSVKLGKILDEGYRPRSDVYDNIDWYIGTAKTDEIAVWKGAGGLPIPWTKGSLSQTARKVRTAIEKKSKLLRKRIRRALPEILANSLDIIQKDRYFLPIILPAGTFKSCRRGLKKFKGDIDDGCMRAIALAVSGKKTIKAYIGLRRTRD